MRSEFQISISASRWTRRQEQGEIRKEPVVRQYLVLAEQIKRIREENPKRTMRDIAKWLGYSPARLSQIYKLTFLAPTIKEEILLSDSDRISTMSLTTICKISDELDLEKQIRLWV
jgi:hypothetical protein